MMATLSKRRRSLQGWEGRRQLAQAENKTYSSWIVDTCRGFAVQEIEAEIRNAC